MIRATFRVTTPMFSGGASGMTAELRPPSLNGVLRFWWRACAWSRFAGDLDVIRNEEECTFGSPRTGQSRVAIRLHTAQQPRKLAPPAVLAPDRKVGPGARYLGYGLMHTAASTKKKKRVQAAELIRECLMPPFDLTVELRDWGLLDDRRAVLLDAVVALGLLGGMGARSRRGWGSLSLVSVDGDVATEHLRSQADLHRRLQELGHGRRDGSPAYTALSSGSRFLVGRREGSDPLTVLNQVGLEYQAFRRSERSDGQRSTVEGDREIVVDDRSTEKYPQRVAFGLPINYGENKPVVEPAGRDRRASPLFFHIHDCNGRAVPVVAFLPAEFLRDPRIVMRGGGMPERTRELPHQPEAVYRPVHEFLDYLSRPGGSFAPIAGEDR